MPSHSAVRFDQTRIFSRMTQNFALILKKKVFWSSAPLSTSCKSQFWNFMKILISQNWSESDCFRQFRREWAKFESKFEFKCKIGSLVIHYTSKTSTSRNRRIFCCQVRTSWMPLAKVWSKIRMQHKILAPQTKTWGNLSLHKLSGGTWS